MSSRQTRLVSTRGSGIGAAAAFTSGAGLYGRHPGAASAAAANSAVQPALADLREGLYGMAKNPWV
jgi:flavin-dependent dehydrogenase